MHTGIRQECNLFEDDHPEDSDSEQESSVAGAAAEYNMPADDSVAGLLEGSTRFPWECNLFEIGDLQDSDSGQEDFETGAAAEANMQAGDSLADILEASRSMMAAPSGASVQQRLPTCIFESKDGEPFTVVVTEMHTGIRQECNLFEDDHPEDSDSEQESSVAGAAAEYNMPADDSVAGLLEGSTRFPWECNLFEIGDLQDSDSGQEDFETGAAAEANMQAGDSLADVLEASRSMIAAPSGASIQQRFPTCIFESKDGEPFTVVVTEMQTGIRQEHNLFEDDRSEDSESEHRDLEAGASAESNGSPGATAEGEARP